MHALLFLRDTIVTLLSAVQMLYMRCTALVTRVFILLSSELSVASSALRPVTPADCRAAFP